MLLLLISFVGGALTVLAPCILPLLPIIIGGSLGENKTDKKKAFTVIFSLGASVIVFTLLLKASTLFIDIPEYTWKLISGSIVLILGCITLFPSLWENQLLAKLNTESNVLLGKGETKKSFWGNVLVGTALGPVFSTCSPTYFIVLATVLPANPILGTVYLLAYSLGLCLALFLVTFVGQKIMDKLGIAADPRSTFKKVLGVIFILVGIAILTGFDKKVESAILDAGFFDITKIEQKLLEKENGPATNNQSTKNQEDKLNVLEKEIVETKTKKTSTFLNLEQKLKKFKRAPEISSPDGFINISGKSISIQELKGKVVLLDIWTYSCINCQRTLPYLNDWYAKYKDEGLEIIGLHTPEFAFERILANVENAVQKFKIKYPVVLDNDYSTWNELGNRFWPRKYLIDIDGFIVYDHIGEGDYDDTEQEIQKALRERVARMNMKEEISTSMSKPVGVIAVEQDKVKSPEVYFGSLRNTLLGNGSANVSENKVFSLPAEFSPNKLYLDGTWEITPEYAENETPAEIIFNYEAKNVYMAAGSDQEVEIEIYQDEKLVKKITVQEEGLYSLIEGVNYATHILRLKVLSPGLQAFTFTFG